MAYIIQHYNDQEIGRWELSDRPVKIGRSPNVDITLQDKGISREHCQIRRRGNLFFLTDLNSSNGTYINNKRILHGWLLDKDEIAIGKFTFMFSDPEYSSNPVDDKSRLLFAFEGGHEEEKERNWTISVSGPDGDKEIRMFKSDYLVGKTTWCDILVDGKDVSDVHVLIIKTGQSLRILNLSMKKPTFINNAPAEKKTEISEKSTVLFGQYSLTLTPE